MPRSEKRDAAVLALICQSHTVRADPATCRWPTGVKPQTPLKLSRRSRLRYRWTMATERFRRSLARRIYDFEDGW